METSREIKRKLMCCLAPALVLCAVACGDDSGQAAPTAPVDSHRVDAATDLDASSPDTVSDRLDAGRAAGEFGFGDQSIDPLDDEGAPIAADPAPAGWSCSDDFAGDGICDCGCGGADRDCGDTGCQEPGCSAPACQVCFAAGGTVRDCAAPSVWSCMRALQGDGVCDCGCGAPDPDCAVGRDNLGCYLAGCSVPGCERCPAGDGGACASPPPYTCEAQRIGDGVCDCGCGNIDPDCRAASCDEPGCSVSGCERCTDDGGKAVDCAAPASTCDPGTFGDGVCDCGCAAADPDCGADAGCPAPGCEDAACETCHDAVGRAVPCPGAWTCALQRFADGVSCDCGCGRPDPDCGDAGCSEASCNDEACDVRHAAAGKAIRPGSWSCTPGSFDGGDGCDCGCGAIDPDCTPAAPGCAGAGCNARSCDSCRQANGAPFECLWTCAPARLGDGVCDCGCGTLDPDCGKLGCADPGCYGDACERCQDSDGAYECERGQCAAGFVNDGVCDCGCRERDVDCITVVACLEPGCGESGCGRCHDDDGNVERCSSWDCSLEKQGGGDGCNCGCGAPDPDCGEADGCAGPGCLNTGCITCRAADGAPMSCSI